MKTLIALTALLLSIGAYGQSTATYGSTTLAPRADPTSNLVDWWMVKGKACQLISCFGYNSGSQQFLQFFDCIDSPTISVSGFDNSANYFTNSTTQTSALLGTGDRVQLTNTVAGVAAGIYYAIAATGNRFAIATTLANAQAGTKITLTGASASASFQRLPVNALAIGASDNFSVLVPVTGMGFGKGCLVAVSTTAATYTAGPKNLVLYVTLSPLQ